MTNPLRNGVDPYQPGELEEPLPDAIQEALITAVRLHVDEAYYFGRTHPEEVGEERIEKVTQGIIMLIRQRVWNAERYGLAARDWTPKLDGDRPQLPQ